MSNNTTTSSLVLTLSTIELRMSTIAMPILLVFGSSGNIFNVFIFLQKTLRSSSCSMYMITAYLLHTLVLCFAMSTNLYSLTHIDPLTYSVPYCKIRQYLISAIFTMARCCVGMACFDRYAISSHDVNIRVFGRPQVARCVIPIIIIIWLILPVHLIIFNTIQNGRCLMPGLYTYFFAAYAIIIAAIIPPSMMITFSILAAKNIRQLRRRIQPMLAVKRTITNINTTTKGSNYIRLKQYDYQLLKMLLVDVTIYCISAVPSPIYYIYAAITLKSVKNVEQVAWQSFFSYLSYQFLLYIAASTSFYTNVWVSREFRNELQSFLHRYVFNKRQVTITNSRNKIRNNSIQLGSVADRNNPRLAMIQQRSNSRRIQHEQ